MGGIDREAAPDRLPPLSPDQMTLEQQTAAEEINSGPRGAVLGPFAPLLRSPELMSRLQKTGEYLRFVSPLDRRLFEMTILIVSRWWDQQFEWGFHHPLALQAGLHPAVADAIAHGRRPQDMDEAAAATWDLLDELHGTRAVTDATFARALTVLGESGVVEIVTAAGYYTTLAMVMNTARTPSPPGRAPLPNIRSAPAEDQA
jgi:4-carboxymuconolactone decarboxylase